MSYCNNNCPWWCKFTAIGGFVLVVVLIALYVYREFYISTEVSIDGNWIAGVAAFGAVLSGIGTSFAVWVAREAIKSNKKIHKESLEVDVKKNELTNFKDSLNEISLQRNDPDVKEVSVDMLSKEIIVSRNLNNLLVMYELLLQQIHDSKHNKELINVAMFKKDIHELSPFMFIYSCVRGDHTMPDRMYCYGLTGIYKIEEIACFAILATLQLNHYCGTVCGLVLKVCEIIDRRHQLNIYYYCLVKLGRDKFSRYVELRNSEKIPIDNSLTSFL